MSNGEYHLTRRQLERLIRAGSSIRDRTLLLLFAETGMRRSEACGLRVSDIRFPERLLLVRNGKGGKSRLVPMTERLTLELRRLSDAGNRDSLFTGRSGRSLSVRQANRIVADAGRRAGVRNPNPRQSQVTCHLFRHSFARLWKEQNGSIESLSKILGHASVKTTWDLYGTEGLREIQGNYLRTMRRINAGSTKVEEVTGDEDQ